MSEFIRHDVQTDTLSIALDRVADALDDLSPLMALIGDLLVNQTEENFRTGTAPDGTAWAPKSMTTMEAYRRREAKGANGPVPADPLIGPSRSLSTTISYEALTDAVDWGSNMIYAAVMQFGAGQGEFGARIGKDKNGRDFFMTIPWGDIPARRFLGIGPDDETAILAEIEDWLELVAAG